MVTSLDGFRRMQDLYGAMGKDQDNRKPEFKDHFAVAVSENQEARSVMRDRLANLFVVGLTGLEREDSPDHKTVAAPNHYPIPGTPDDLLSNQDVVRALDDASRLLPETEDPSFAAAITDRQAGIIRLLGLMINVHASGRDTGATRRSLEMLSRSALNDEGQPIPLSQLPWDGENGRRVTLAKRAGSIQQNLDTAVLRSQNDELYGELFIKSADVGLGKEFFAAVRVIGTQVGKFADSAFRRAQWTNVAYKKLAAMIAAPKGNTLVLLSGVLQGFVTDLTAANSAAEVTTCIDSLDKDLRVQNAASGAVPKGGAQA